MTQQTLRCHRVARESRKSGRPSAPQRIPAVPLSARNLQEWRYHALAEIIQIQGLPARPSQDRPACWIPVQLSQVAENFRESFVNKKYLLSDRWIERITYLDCSKRKHGYIHSVVECFIAPRFRIIVGTSISCQGMSRKVEKSVWFERVGDS